MSNVKDFLRRKDIVITPQRYLIEALGAMAQGLFASLLIGTIIKTLGQQTGLDVLVDLGSYATAMSGPAMAVAIGWALHCPPLVLFSLVTVGYSSNALGGAGGPLAVLIIAIVAAELGKAVSKETKIDILVTPLVTIFAGVGLSMLIAAPIGAAAKPGGHPHHVGHRAGPAGHGHPRLGHRGRGADPAHLLRRHLRGPGPDGSGRRCRRGGLLRPDGGLCRDELSGKRRGRPGQPGPGHQYAPDGQHRQEPPHLDRPHAGLRPSPARWPPACSTWR